MESRWTWRLFSIPGIAWLSLFFLVAFYAVLCVAFGNQDTLSQPVPFWNPLDWNVGYVPPQRALDAESLVKTKLIPGTLAPAVVTPEQFSSNQELLALSVEGERLWDQAWSKFKAG